MANGITQDAVVGQAKSTLVQWHKYIFLNKPMDGSFTYVFIHSLLQDINYKVFYV